MNKSRLINSLRKNILIGIIYYHNMKFPKTADIKSIRKNLDVTQAELAKLSGVSQSTIAKIEAENISAGYDTVVKLFETLEELKDRNYSIITAADVLSKDIISIQSTDNIHTASEIMMNAGFSQLPVMNGDIPVGSISEKKIFGLLVDGKTMNEIGKIKLEEIMEESFPIVSETMPMTSVANIMIENNAILVSHKGHIIGMITNADILKLI